MSSPATGSTRPAHPSRPPKHNVPWPLEGIPGTARPLERWALALLLLGTGALYLWNLGANGWANAYYSAAIQAGAASWKAFLFGSFDASNAITVDKPPASLWIPELSVRLFGLNSYAILVPEVLMGIAAVFLLHSAVSRVAGRPAGLLAGAVLALTPVTLLMFRYNNPEALLVLLLTAAAYALVRALQARGRQAMGWMVLLGALLGLAFLTKQLQGLLVVPGFALSYLFTAKAGWPARVGHVLAAGAGLLISAGWWVALIQFWPADQRPYVGGSQSNSFLQLTLGYNGLGRISGLEVGSVGNPRRSGWTLWRMFTGGFATQISWLLPAALILLAASLWVLLHSRAWRGNPGRVTLGLVLGLGCWLVLTVVVFSYMRGTIHTYYSVALAPAIAGLVGIGAVLMWRNRSSAVPLAALAASVIATGYWASKAVAHDPHFIASWGLGFLELAILGAMLVLAAAWAGLARTTVRGLAPLALAVSLVAALAAPAAYAVATAQGPRTGALVVAGPVSQPVDTAGVGGGLLHVTTPGARVLELLRAHAADYRWVAATNGANNAAGYQLGSGHPVMVVGGFNGTDPYPTLEQFQHEVADGQIHYWIDGHLSLHPNGGSRQALLIHDWVHAHFTGVTVDGSVLYDLAPGAGLLR
jgi:4-amino-4-deoxy-L-arabinose transferase-like glycosyltransferase